MTWPIYGNNTDNSKTNFLILNLKPQKYKHAKNKYEKKNHFYFSIYLQMKRKVFVEILQSKEKRYFWMLLFQ